MELTLIQINILIKDISISKDVFFVTTHTDVGYIHIPLFWCDWDKVHYLVLLIHLGELDEILEL